ncbi:hypothetical protein Esti_000479 [Eimeria stiedai]
MQRFTSINRKRVDFTPRSPGDPVAAAALKCVDRQLICFERISVSLPVSVSLHQHQRRGGLQLMDLNEERLCRSSKGSTTAAAAAAAVGGPAEGQTNPESPGGLGFPVAAVRAYPSSRSSSRHGSKSSTGSSKKPRGAFTVSGGTVPLHESSDCPRWAPSPPRGRGPPPYTWRDSAAAFYNGDRGPPPPPQHHSEGYASSQGGPAAPYDAGGDDPRYLEGRPREAYMTYTPTLSRNHHSLRQLQQLQQQLEQQQAEQRLTESAPAAAGGGEGGAVADLKAAAAPAAAAADAAAAAEARASEGGSEGKPEAAADTEGDQVRLQGVKAAMLLFVLLQVTFNVDNGIVPAVLPQLWEEFHLADAQQGLLGALPYVGTALMSPLNSRLLSALRAKCFLCLSLCCNAAACCLFAAARRGPALLVSRLLVGATQAPFVIFAPVWVDAFAPAPQLTLWMGLLQGSVVLGVMLGYLAAGFLRSQGKDWRIAVYGQLGMLLLLLLLLSFVKSPILDTDAQHRKQQQEMQQQQQLLQREGVDPKDNEDLQQQQQQQQLPLQQQESPQGLAGSARSPAQPGTPPSDPASGLCLYKGGSAVSVRPQTPGSGSAVAVAAGARPSFAAAAAEGPRSGTHAALFATPASSCFGFPSGGRGPQEGSMCGDGRGAYEGGSGAGGPYGLLHSRNLLTNTLVYPLTPSMASLALRERPRRSPSGGPLVGPPVSKVSTTSSKGSTCKQLQRHCSAPPRTHDDAVLELAPHGSLRRISFNLKQQQQQQQQASPQASQPVPLTVEQLLQQQQQQRPQELHETEAYMQLWGSKHAASGDGAALAAAVAAAETPAATLVTADAAAAGAAGTQHGAAELGWAVPIPALLQQQQRHSVGTSAFPHATMSPAAAAAAAADSVSVESIPGEGPNPLLAYAAARGRGASSPRRLSAPQIAAAATAAAATANARFSLLMVPEGRLHQSLEQQLQHHQEEQQQHHHHHPFPHKLVGRTPGSSQFSSPNTRGPTNDTVSVAASGSNSSSSSKRQSLRHWVVSQGKTLAAKAAVGVDLLRNPVYGLVVGGLCSLFLEVTAIQFWSTKYFEQVPTATVLLSFSLTAVTAPLLGILLGGVLVDRGGGYREGRQQMLSLLVVAALAAGCVLCGAVAAAAKAFAAALVAIWLVLFLGGGILPPATGMVLACVSPERRTDASGFAILIYTLFGYMLGSFLPGVLNDLFGLAAGMRVSLLWSIFGFLEFAAAAVVSWRQQEGEVSFRRSRSKASAAAAAAAAAANRVAEGALPHAAEGAGAETPMRSSNAPC